MPRYILFIFFFSLLQSYSHGQREHVPEEELEIQKLLIEAKREQLLSNNASAIKLYKSILKRDENYPVVSYELARLLLENNEADEAFTYAQQAYRLDEKNIWYGLLVAKIYEDQETYGAAAKIYESLHSKLPDHFKQYDKWAANEVLSGEIEKAIEVYNKKESDVGFRESIVRKRYDLYLKLKKEKKAEEQILLLTEKEPDNIEYLHILADHYLRFNKKGKVADIYSKIIKIDPNDGKAQFGLISDQQKNKSPKSNRQSLIENPSIGLDDKIKELIPLLQKENPSPEEIIELEKLVQILNTQHPKEAKVQALSGDLYFVSDKFSTAAQYYEKALEIEDGNYILWENFLFILDRLDRIDELDKNSQKALDLFPNSGIIHYLGARAKFKKEAWAESLSLLEQAKFMSTRSLTLVQDICVLQALNNVKRGDKEKALSRIKEAIETLEDRANGFVYQAFILSEIDNSDNSIQELIKKINSKNIVNPELLSVISETFWNIGDTESAIKTLEKSISLGGNGYPYHFIRMGEFLEKSGRSSEAKAFYKRASDLGSNHSALKDKLAG